MGPCCGVGLGWCCNDLCGFQIGGLYCRGIIGSTLDFREDCEPRSLSAHVRETLFESLPGHVP